MPHLYAVDTGADLGEITQAQLDFLIAKLEEESSEDQDYYITADTLDYFAARGADPSLVAMLRAALGNSTTGFDVRWA